MSGSSPISSLHQIRRRLRDYRLQVAARAAALILVTVVAVLAGFHGGTVAWISVIVLSLIGLRLLVGIVLFTERPLREIVRFIEGIRYDDFTVHISRRNSGPLLTALANGFEEVGDALRMLRTQREEKAHFLDMVIRHVPVALIAIESGGNVTVFNPAARRLLGVPRLRHVSQLGAISPVLEKSLRGLVRSEGTLIRLEHNGRNLDLAVHHTHFRLGTQATTLVSLQDIRQELEEKELEAWQQLTRVLTHEIVNSVTPIASLASTASERAAKAASPEDLDGVREALSTIERRSQGLVRFVDVYRSLARLPKPRLDLVSVSDLFAGTRMLLAHALEASDITIETSIRPPELQLNVDPELIEQVLLNLVLNAIQALEGRADGRIQLKARVNGVGHSLIEVCDNGPGIAPDVQERIFVPFFSTKQTGSGIGLSLSRQIIRLHNGSLTVDSKPDEQTVFTIRL